VNVAERFSKNLVRIRKEAGYSQEDVADLASIHRTEIGMLERGFRLPRLDTLVKLVGGLGVSYDELLSGIEWQPGTLRPGEFRETPREEE